MTNIFCIIALLIATLFCHGILNADPTNDQKNDEEKKIDPKKTKEIDFAILQEQLKTISDTYPLVANISKDNKLHQMNCLFVTDKYCSKYAPIYRLKEILPKDFKIEVIEMDASSFHTKSKF